MTAQQHMMLKHVTHCNTHPVKHATVMPWLTTGAEERRVLARGMKE
jgi:hypothetical protein